MNGNDEELQEVWYFGERDDYDNGGSFGRNLLYGGLLLIGLTVLILLVAR